MATETFGIINSLASATVEVNIYGYTIYGHTGLYKHCLYILTTQFQSFIRGHVTLIGMGVLAWALSITHNTSLEFL